MTHICIEEVIISLLSLCHALSSNGVISMWRGEMTGGWRPSMRLACHRLTGVAKAASSAVAASAQWRGVKWRNPAILKILASARRLYQA
jgi:hypothetical protein